MCRLMWFLLYVLGMWIVHREKKPQGRVESDVWYLQNTSHSSHTSSPHKAFRSEENLTLPLQNGSEKRRHQEVIRAISLPVPED